jgi:uncharacterized protein (DUF1684 family)
MSNRVARWVAITSAAVLTATAPRAGTGATTARGPATASANRVIPAKPVALDAVARDTLTHSIEKGREETREWLREKPTSYLATVLRRDFGDRSTMTVGRDAKSDVRIDDPALQPTHLRVTVDGDSFHVEAVDPGANFLVRDTPTTRATVGPSSIRVGRYTLRLSHQRFPAIIVFDPQSPRYKEYKGIEYFPVDLSYRYVLPLTVNPSPDTVVILSTRGNQRRALRVGWFDFLVGKKPCRLEATRLLEPGVGENDFGIFFQDRTTGKETYGVGRYVDVEPLGDGRYVLDFNQAYNPACAYSEHYNCPIPPRANHLTVAIQAGEKDAHYLSH